MSSLSRFAFLVFLVAPAPSRAPALAAPQVIVFNGGRLHHRITLADFSENLHLMHSTAHVVSASFDSLRNRPGIRVAMYWGSQWKGRVDLPDSVSIFGALNGAQAGVLYPAWRGTPALWVFEAFGATPRSIRAISREGIALLMKHEIPVVIDSPDAEP